jgi:hypothetical protein
LFFFPACCYPVRYDGPYKGKIIDAETGTPIEGVVVLGEWSKVAATPAGGVSSYYDAQETVTDKNGEFEIPGLGLKILSNVAPMNVLIFKAGYEYIGIGPWESLKLDGGLLEKKIAFEGEKAIIPLKKSTLEERKTRRMPDIYLEEKTEGGVTHFYIPKKIKHLIEEINKELIEQGLKPLDGE